MIMNNDKKMKITKERLFNIYSLEDNPNYISPGEKRKWTNAFRKWCIEQWLEKGHLHGTFCCGYMRICDECDGKYMVECKDCVEAIKTIYKQKNKEIPYRNYNFEEILREVECE